MTPAIKVAAIPMPIPSDMMVEPMLDASEEVSST
eukprot:CAMPEP_0198111368 /NCGR_PEP_ID=MMETSP1442-20131203/3331_1 /TAXON_ID= /ORGANISM="Craspedostauros australis, Strain CCMP3328" /LENGTH=33 /DNA_ID= /DNA_START= /DNA_END= /DNA_ORIENTATION=